jgi:hypothetical protein
MVSLATDLNLFCNSARFVQYSAYFFVCLIFLIFGLFMFSYSAFFIPNLPRFFVIVGQ